MSINKTKVLSLILTATILTILVFSGPANAFIVGMSVEESIVDVGEDVHFNIDVQLENDEKKEDVNNLTLKLDGPGISDVNCYFNVDGGIISGCPGIAIVTSMENNTIGYGNRIKLIYNITLDSTGYMPGEYTTEITLLSGVNQIVQSGDNIIISDIVENLEGCSIRGEDGLLTYNGSTGTNNKINLHIPRKNAVKSSGQLQSHGSDLRLSYQFKLDDILQNNNKSALLVVSGQVKSLYPPKKFNLDGALIKVDKKNKIINISSTAVNLTNMKITFMRNC